jgi:hypothetical protein
MELGLVVVIAAADKAERLARRSSALASHFII